MLYTTTESHGGWGGDGGVGVGWGSGGAGIGEQWGGASPVSPPKAHQQLETGFQFWIFLISDQQDCGFAVISNQIKSKHWELL